MLKDLYIVRHGHPQSGTGIPYDRVPGPPLSPVGQAEAQSTSEFLRNRAIDEVYSSPLERALNTAKIISAEIGAPLLIDPDLAEQRSDEPFENVKARIRQFMARVDGDDAATLAFVAHGAPIKALLQILSFDTLDLSKYMFQNGNHVPTAGVWHATRDMFGAWQLSLVFKPAVPIPADHIPQ